MAEIVQLPKEKRKFVAQRKCFCGCIARYYENDVWTEYGNTEARCPHCGTVIFLGRFGFDDTYGTALD